MAAQGAFRLRHGLRGDLDHLNRLRAHPGLRLGPHHGRDAATSVADEADECLLTNVGMGTAITDAVKLAGAGTRRNGEVHRHRSGRFVLSTRILRVVAVSRSTTWAGDRPLWSTLARVTNVKSGSSGATTYQGENSCRTYERSPTMPSGRNRRRLGLVEAIGTRRTVIASSMNQTNMNADATSDKMMRFRPARLAR